MLDAVYVDAKDLKRIVAVQPKPAFRPIFQVATTKEGSGVVLIKEPPEASREALETSPCSWWRRGRVERYLKHGLAVLAAGNIRAPIHLRLMGALASSQAGRFR